MSEEVNEQVDQPVANLQTPAEVASGGSGNDFKSLIPEEIRDHPSLSPIKDVENLARSYVNAQRLVGADKIPMPVNPTDEDLDMIYSRLGRPEDVNGYDIPVDGNIINEDVANSYKDIAHKLRLNPDQAKGILEFYRSHVENAREGMTQDVEAQIEKTESELRQEWGRAYDQRVESARSVVNEFFDPAMLEMTLSDGTMIGNHPSFIKAFAQLADFRQSVTSEDTISDQARNTVMTPSQAQAEIDAILNDKTHAYWDRKNPVGREKAVERVKDLMEMIHG